MRCFTARYFVARPFCPRMDERELIRDHLQRYVANGKRKNEFYREARKILNAPNALQTDDDDLIEIQDIVPNIEHGSANLLPVTESYSMYYLPP